MMWLGIGGLLLLILWSFVALWRAKRAHRRALETQRKEWDAEFHRLHPSKFPQPAKLPEFDPEITARYQRSRKHTVTREQVHQKASVSDSEIPSVPIFRVDDLSTTTSSEERSDWSGGGGHSGGAGASGSWDSGSSDSGCSSSSDSGGDSGGGSDGGSCGSGD